MQRRTFLIWFGRAVYTACAAIIATPTLRFLAAPLAKSPAEGRSISRRIARLDSLPVGEPRRLAILGTRQNGWTRYPDQVVGHIWVTRVSPAATPAGQTELSVFNASCPHRGCPIQEAVKTGFSCPCHGAKFAADGTRVADADFVNPSPRDMDPLGHRVVKDEATGQWWLEVDFQEFEVGRADRVEKA